MWRILKAEISYDRSRLWIVSVFYLTCLMTIWFGVKWERNVSPMTMLILFISALVAVYAGEQGRISNKRDRMHVSLPVSLRKTGFLHLLYPVCVWIAFLLLYQITFIVLEFLSGTTRLQASFSQILTLSGLFLVVNAAILLSRDLSRIFTKKSQQFIIYIIGYLLFIGALLPFYIVTNFFGAFGENTRLQFLMIALFESPAGFLLVGFGLSILSTLMFLKRRSYVQS